MSFQKITQNQHTIDCERINGTAISVVGDRRTTVRQYPIHQQYHLNFDQKRMNTTQQLNSFTIQC